MSDRIMRDELRFLLRRGNAHLDFDTAVAGLAPEFHGAKVPHLPHTPWRLLEHMRLAQCDILEFCRDAKHVSPPFPDGYWPQGDAPPDDEAWEKSLAAFHDDTESMIDLVGDPATDLFALVPHGDGQTIFRQALLVADHNAYHLGQLVALRRALGAWPE